MQIMNEKLIAFKNMCYEEHILKWVIWECLSLGDFVV